MGVASDGPWVEGVKLILSKLLRRTRNAAVDAASGNTDCKMVQSGQYCVYVGRNKRVMRADAECQSESISWVVLDA
jgi:hypothetical protein